MESTSLQPHFYQPQPHFYRAGVVWADGPSSAHLQSLLAGTLCTKGTVGRSPMARCSLFGDDFINTFDESMYSFAGDCSYLLAGDCQKHSFSLIGESGALKGGIQGRCQLSSTPVRAGVGGIFLGQCLSLQIPEGTWMGMACP